MVYLVYDLAATFLLTVSLPLLPFLLISRRVRTGFAERFGFYPKAVLTAVGGSRPIWIHAASVGEVIAAGQLSRELKMQLPSRKIIVSTFTMTGSSTACKVTAADAVIFLPLDHLWTVRRGLRQIDPSVLIIIETEIWPNLLREAHQRGVPIMLLSGRLSAGSLKRYTLCRSFFRQVLSTFSLLGMQSDADAARILSLGAEAGRVRVLGNLKHAVSARGSLPPDKNERTDGTGTGGRSLVLVVGSSHAGEEEALIGVFRALKLRFPTLQMVLAPRHPPRFPEVEKLLQSHNLEYQKKSLMNGSADFDRDVLLLDTLGDLEQFYARGDVAFVGGSLVNGGGHNLLEPARFRKPVLFGPYTSNFAALAAEMTTSGGGIQVSGAKDLEQALASLLGDDERRRAAGEKAYRIAVDDRGVMQKTLAAARVYLPSEELR
jgi:3-deoxy-D-manno-octulosonic-acid transferase